jgi:hypothetical protein
MASEPSAVFELQEQFRSSPYWAIRQLVCDIDRERAIVRGTVPSYYLKQVAEAMLAKAAGIHCIHSHICVRSA